MGQKLSWLLADEEAGRLYRRRPGLVAFVDESYRALPEGPVYIMTGVVHKDPSCCWPRRHMPLTSSRGIAGTPRCCLDLSQVAH